MPITKAAPKKASVTAPKAGLEPFSPGARSAAMFEEEAGYFTPGLQSIALFSRLAMERGRGAELFDVDGNRYVDFAAGIGVASVGHSHPTYVKMVQEQVARLSVGSFTTENRLAFSRLFSRNAPNGLTRLQLYSSGAEAVEAALRLARSHTRKFEVVSFWGGFHGKTGGVLGLLADDFKFNLGPLAPGVYSSPYPNPYRCPLGAEGEHDCAAHCLQFLREKLRRETTGALAAIIAEPIQGTAGNIVPAPGFLPGLQAIARENGALLIADEMITGFGRTGKLFGHTHEPVQPDIMTLGKGLAGGFPVSAIATTPEIAVAKPFANPSGSSSSYGGNPLASAACHAALKITLEEKLVQNSAEVGAHLMARLKALGEKYRFIGDVRGRGLMIGVELVADRKTKAPLPKPVTRALYDEALKRGLVSMCYSSTIRVNPPLVITRALADEGVAKLDESFAAVAKAFSLS